MNINQFFFLYIDQGVEDLIYVRAYEMALQFTIASLILIKKLCVVQVVIYVLILTMVCMTKRRENNRLNIKESSDRWCFLSIGIYGILNFQQRIS